MLLRDACGSVPVPWSAVLVARAPHVLKDALAEHALTHLPSFI